MDDYSNFKVTTGKDGICVITWAMAERSMNVITSQVMDELDAIIDHVGGDDTVAGAVIVSGKKDYTAGADITILAGISDIVAKAKKFCPQLLLAALWSSRFFHQSRKN